MPTKDELRARVREARARLDPEAVRRSGFALSEVLLAQPRIEQAACVAVYTSFGQEPSTRPLRAALRVRGVLVLIPYLLSDGSLDWVDDDRVVLAAADARADRESAVRPEGPRLGPAAIGRADVVILPALAVAADGVRLGQGGGSYDRALPTASPAALRVTLLHDGEFLPAGSLPAEPHDQPVDAVALPSGWHPVSSGRA